MKPRIGIFGGTFDPIHFGHLRCAEEIREQFCLDRVIFVPPYVHPLKQTPNATNAAHRFEMAQLAVENNPSFVVSDYEVARGEISYTVITLDYFRRVFSSACIFFIVGADSWLDITHWYEYQRLFELANMIVHSRPGYNAKGPEEVLPPEVASRLVYDGEVYCHESGNTLRFASVTDLRISATDIRRRLAEGKTARYLLPKAVLEYIEKYGLYCP